MFFGESAGRRGRLRALAALCVVAGLAGAGAQLWPASGYAARPSSSGVVSSGDIALVSAVSLASAQQDYATFSVTPTSVTAGEVTEFTLTVMALETFKGGVVVVEVPGGWSPPTTTGSAGSPGFTSVAWQGPQRPDVSTGSTTITVTDIALASGQSIIVSYWASASEPPSPPSETVSFTGMAQQFASSQQQSLSGGQVTVMSAAPPESASASATLTTPASSSPATTPPAFSSPAITVSSSPSALGGSSSHLPLALLVGLAAAACLAVLLVVWLVRRRPVPLTEQRIRATPHTGPPAQVAVRTTGKEPTLTVRVAPHPDAGTTTIEEVPP